MGGLTVLNQWSVFWSCTGLIVIITVLSAFAPHQNASWVFTHYQNQTGFENPGYVLVLGMIGAAYSLFGKKKSSKKGKKSLIKFQVANVLLP